MKPCKLALCIDSLNPGGAERQFIELVKGLNKKRFAVHVIILNRKGAFYKDLEAIENIKIYCLKRKPFIYLPIFLSTFYRLLKEIQPDIIHGYMGGTNELCLLMGKLVRSRVVWGIRASNMLLAHYRMRTRILFKTGAVLSRFADLIISNSEAGRKFHASKGYHCKKMIVVHNGIDHERFYPDIQGGKDFRKKWGIEENAFLVGLAARIDPKKGHDIFIKAAARLSEKYRDLMFLCAGGFSDTAYYNKIRAESASFADKMIFARSVSEMRQFYNALDISVSSSSFGEGFSNTIAESMACGVPCVVTEVGDSSYVVGDAGMTVPPDSPEALTGAIKSMKMLSIKEREGLGIKARKRILENFSIHSLVANTSTELEKLVNRSSAS